MLPITIIQFLAARVTGGCVVAFDFYGVSVWRAGKLFTGRMCILGKRIEKPIYLTVFNEMMAAVLVWVALDIGYEFGYFKLS